MVNNDVLDAKFLIWICTYISYVGRDPSYWVALFTLLQLNADSFTPTNWSILEELEKMTVIAIKDASLPLHPWRSLQKSKQMGSTPPNSIYDSRFEKTSRLHHNPHVYSSRSCFWQVVMLYRKHKNRLISTREIATTSSMPSIDLWKYIITHHTKPHSFHFEKIAADLTTEHVQPRITFQFLRDNRPSSMHDGPGKVGPR